MSNQNVKNYGKKFDSERARAAGSAPKSPRAKTILKRILEQKINADSQDWGKLAKMAGLDPKTATRLDVMLETFSRRMVKNDASLKMGLEIGGELKPNETSSRTAPPITIVFTKPKPDADPSPAKD